MAGEITPYYDPGQHVTGKPSAAVIGGRFVQVDADSDDWAPEGLKTAAIANVVPIEHAPAGSRGFGVAHKSVDPSLAPEELVTVLRSCIVPCTAGAAVTAGVEVEIGNDGKVITLASGIAVGYAMHGAAADGDTIAVALYS